MLTYIESWQGFNLVDLSSSLKDFKSAMADHCIKIFDCRLSYKFDKAKKEKRFFLFPKKPSEPNPRECQQFILFLQEFVCWISHYRVLNLGLVFEPAKSTCETQQNLHGNANWFGLSSLCVLKNAQQLLKFFRAERVIYEGNVRIISYKIMMRWF